MNASAISNDKMPMGLMAVGLIVLVIGLMGALQVLTVGHTNLNASSALPWGLPISAYLFFVLSSTGLTFVASLATVFGIKSFYPIAKRASWLALATLVAGFLTLGLEIGHPFRMIWAIPLNLQIASPMFWMGVFYTLYMVFLIWKIILIHRNDWDSALSKRVAIASFVTVIIAHAVLGLVFAMMAMRPYWYGGFTPVYFLFTAALSGVAVITLFAYLADGFKTDRSEPEKEVLMTKYLPNIMAALLVVVFLFTVSKLITGLWTNQPEINLVTNAIVSSPLFILEFWIGMVLPLVIMLTPSLRKQAKFQALSAALLIMALFIGRYEFVIGGQLVPLFKGTWYTELLSYTPSFSEIGLVLTGLGIGLLIYAVGIWKFRVNEAK